VKADRVFNFTRGKLHCFYCGEVRVGKYKQVVKEKRKDGSQILTQRFTCDECNKKLEELK